MILLVANYEPHVGYAWNFIAKFWLQLATRGKCHLAYPAPGAVPAEIVQAGIATHTQSMRGWGSIGFIRRHGFRAVYLTDWPALSPLYALWRLAGVRQIVVHDHVPGDPPPATGLRRLIKRALHALRILSADQYVAVTEHVRQRHINTWCIPADRCVTVWNGIEPFEADIAARASVRAELGIPDDAVVFSLVGRASVYKNWRFAVECLPYLPANVHFIHCGDGPDLPVLMERTRRLGLESRMHWLGKRSDVRRIVSACDAAFHPSRGEVGFSLSMLEFMSIGLPVVVPNLASVSLAIDHMLTGLVYRPEDIDSAVTALTALVDSPELRARLGAAARAKVLRSYTLQRTLRTFDELVADSILPEQAPMGLGIAE